MTLSRSYFGSQRLLFWQRSRWSLATWIHSTQPKRFTQPSRGLPSASSCCCSTMNRSSHSQTRYRLHSQQQYYRTLTSSSDSNGDSDSQETTEPTKPPLEWMQLERALERMEALANEKTGDLTPNKLQRIANGLNDALEHSLCRSVDDDDDDDDDDDFDDDDDDDDDEFLEDDDDDDDEDDDDEGTSEEQDEAESSTLFDLLNDEEIQSYRRRIPTRSLEEDDLPSLLNRDGFDKSPYLRSLESWEARQKKKDIDTLDLRPITKEEIKAQVEKGRKIMEAFERRRSSQQTAQGPSETILQEDEKEGQSNQQSDNSRQRKNNNLRNEETNRYMENHRNDILPRIHKAVTMFALQALPLLNDDKQKDMFHEEQLLRVLSQVCCRASEMGLVLPISIYRSLLQHSLQRCAPIDYRRLYSAEEMLKISETREWAKSIRQVVDALPFDAAESYLICEEEILEPLLNKHSFPLLYLILCEFGHPSRAKSDFLKGVISPVNTVDILGRLRNILFEELDKVQDCWDDPDDPKVISLMEGIVPQLAGLGGWLEHGCREGFRIQRQSAQEMPLSNAGPHLEHAEDNISSFRRKLHKRAVRQMPLWNLLDDDEHCTSSKYTREEIMAFFNKLHMHTFYGPNGVFGSGETEQDMSKQKQFELPGVPPRGLRVVKQFQHDENSFFQTGELDEWISLSETYSESYKLQQQAMDISFPQGNERNRVLDWRRIWAAAVLTHFFKSEGAWNFGMHFLTMADPEMDPDTAKNYADILQPFDLSEDDLPPFDSSHASEPLSDDSQEDLTSDFTSQPEEYQAVLFKHTESGYEARPINSFSEGLRLSFPSPSDNFDPDEESDDESDDDALSNATLQNKVDEYCRWSMRWEEDEVPDVWAQLREWDRQVNPLHDLDDDDESTDPLVHLTPYYRQCIHKNFEHGKTPAAIRQMRPWD